MPALPPYIPAKEAALNTWLLNFAALGSAAPSTYGLTTVQAATIADAVDAWSTAYAPILSPSTKTKAAVSAKNSQKVIVLASLRPFAQAISLNAGVTTDAKTAIGVNPRTSTPTPVTTPTTFPVLSITSALPLQHVIAYRDQLASPTSKAKPYGVTALQLFALPSAAPITDPTAIAFYGVETKSPLLATWASTDAGKSVYYVARWQTRKGLVGPWGPIANFIVAA